VQIEKIEKACDSYGSNFMNKHETKPVADVWKHFETTKNYSLITSNLCLALT